jgi:hypothetical protein
VNQFKLTPTPTPEEAAALIAAVERFLFDTAAPPAASEVGLTGWQLAAMLESVGERDENALW